MIILGLAEISLFIVFAGRRLVASSQGDLEESASHPLPLPEGAPQVYFLATCLVSQLWMVLYDFDEGL